LWIQKAYYWYENVLKAVGIRFLLLLLPAILVCSLAGSVFVDPWLLFDVCFIMIFPPDKNPYIQCLCYCLAWIYFLEIFLQWGMLSTEVSGCANIARCCLVSACTVVVVVTVRKWFKVWFTKCNTEHLHMQLIIFVFYEFYYFEVFTICTCDVLGHCGRKWNSWCGDFSIIVNCM
jgi:hypothetical protein